MICAALALSACTTPAEIPPTLPSGASKAPQVNTSATVAQQRRFARIIAAVEPVAEAECKKRTRKGSNCDFQIAIDDRNPKAPANAYQTLLRDGTPLLAFNLALLASVKNDHELAFVMGHEAAHHIQGHIQRKQTNAVLGAVLLGTLAAVAGAGDAGMRAAQDVGAQVGARTYSKSFELEADRLGTAITAKAGYDPVRGAAYFTRIPDPGNKFLGTHPPNAARIEAVRKAAAGL
ncbi:MAG: M48 family metalloprotease [Primorskyibacter sp.]